MTEQIQRYTFGYVEIDEGAGSAGRELQMIPAKFGEAVKHADHLAAMAKKDEQHKCFHCGFVATTQEDGEAHFGDGDDGEPICRSWERMSKEDRIVDYQGVYKELLAERRTNESLRVSNEGLEYQVDSQKGAIHSYKPFAKCNSINDVFFVYDSMEGRALTAEESVTALQKQVRKLREALSEIPDGRTHYEGCWQDRTHHDCALKRIARVEAERDEYALSDSILRKAYEESGQSSRLTWSGWLHEVVRENAQLRAALARMQGPVTELCEISVKIRELTQVIRSHRCAEYSKPDMSCGDFGTPPCKWSDAEPSEYCANCKMTLAAKAERTAAKRRRSTIVRRLAARAGMEKA